MKGQEYPEGKLSGDYFMLCKKRSSIYGVCPEVCSVIKRRIAESEPEILAAYKKDKNLKNLGVEGFGLKIKEDLELILGKGIDKALADLEAKRAGKLERNSRYFIPGTSEFQIIKGSRAREIFYFEK